MPDGNVFYTYRCEVYAIGNSKGQGICMPDGIVSDRERFISGGRYIMYSASTVAGMMFASYSCRRCRF